MVEPRRLSLGSPDPSCTAVCENMLTAICAEKPTRDPKEGHRSREIIGELIASVALLDDNPVTFRSGNTTRRRTRETRPPTLTCIADLFHSHVMFLSDRPGQRPSIVLENRKALLLELLLCRSDGVFPFLAVALAVNNPVNIVVAQVRMDRLDTRMQLIGR